jgi:hypothetical protein
MGNPREGTKGRGARRHLRAVGIGTLVAEGLDRFEQLMALALDRLPAKQSIDERHLATIARRCTVEVLRAAALRLAEIETAAPLRTRELATKAATAPGPQADAPATQLASAPCTPEAASDGGHLLSRLRLFDDGFCEVTAALDVAPLKAEFAEPEELGELLESLLSLSAQQSKGKLRYSASRQRKQQGMFYTPRAVVASVVLAAMRPFVEADRSPLRVCDPSFGGGAFLIGAARAMASLESRGPSSEVEIRRAVVRRLHGFDIEPMAVAVAEASLMLWARGGPEQARALRDHLRMNDALLQSAQPEASLRAAPTDSAPARPATQIFDLIIGNPPWVAYAGRATQPLPEKRRTWLAENYQAFHGYPTLQACFVELAARLTPNGRIALLVPSPLADLDGYRPMRRVLTRTHRISEELTEYGQDAFEGVVQPCFGLIADAAPNSCESDAPFPLVERSRMQISAARVKVPDCLLGLSRLPRFPSECFKEYGFQTTSEVTSSMLLRADSPSPPHEYPLLQGRDVTEFVVGQPRLYLDPDREKLHRLHCRLRSLEEYHQVEFVVRQTAKYTIAALHNGLPFRNSLLAGFGNAALSAQTLVGLLNSTLLRTVHLAAQRDARQKTFPQVKLVHLRTLPSPLQNEQIAAELARLVTLITGRAPDQSERRQLNALVYDWYGISAEDALVVDRFFEDRTGLT